jgi:S1-C subfamily serine protease
MLARHTSICAVVLALGTSSAFAAGPFGSIRVGNWSGGAYTDDKSGAFSHCAAGTVYNSGINVIIGQNLQSAWLLGFAHPQFRLTPGETFPIDVIFDGQAQFKLFGTAVTESLVTSILPSSNVLEQLKKAHLMVAVAKGTTLQFTLNSTGQLLPVIANCLTKMKTGGLANAGDFSILPPKPAAKPVVQSNAPPPAPASSAKPAKPVEMNGTGFVVSTTGHVVTNHHVIGRCTGDIRGNLTSQAATNLRIVSKDEFNDLALLQAPM